MTLYWATHYDLDSDTNVTSTRLDYNFNHIDIRIDALEGHVATLINNPHHVISTIPYPPVGWYESGTVATGNVGAYPEMQYAGTWTVARAYVNTASILGAITVDILKSSDNGTTWATIFSTKITIDENERDSATAATAAVISATAFAVGDRFKANVDNAGDSAADMTVTLHGTLSVVGS